MTLHPVILAIDPGPTESAWIVAKGDKIVDFAQAAFPTITDRIGRKAVKIHLCGSMRAKDTNIRQALIDRYGGPAAIGRKASPGPLYGITGDVWSALAVAVAWSELARAA